MNFPTDPRPGPGFFLRLAAAPRPLGGLVVGLTAIPEALELVMTAIRMLCLKIHSAKTPLWQTISGHVI